MTLRRGLQVAGAVALLLAGCGRASDPESGDGRFAGRSPRGGGGFPGGGFGGPPGGAPETAAVPVEVTPVTRRSISAYIETQCTLEAENEVDIVARTAGPIVELAAEEGMAVAKGQLLARIDADEIRAQLEASRVSLTEAKLAYERAERLHGEELLSQQEYEQALARYQSAEAQVHGNEVQLRYTEIVAPFDGLIVVRYVKFAEHVTSGTRLFRLSDFDPLLCRIQVPERQLPRLARGQRAYLTVEPWPGERFPASVERIRPVVEAATGTVEVTLEVDGRQRLRPGMFSSVYLETDSHPEALVIPKTALSLESVGDTVYTVAEGEARRREVRLGFREGDAVEVVAGLAEGEEVVVVGQDGLSDGTPVRVTGGSRAGEAAAVADGGGPGEAPPGGERRGDGGGSEARPPERRRPGGGRPAGGFDPSHATPEQLERIKEAMRARGLSEEQIEQRLREARERRGEGGR